MDFSHAEVGLAELPTGSYSYRQTRLPPCPGFCGQTHFFAEVIVENKVPTRHQPGKISKRTAHGGSKECVLLKAHSGGWKVMSGKNAGYVEATDGMVYILGSLDTIAPREILPRSCHCFPIAISLCVGSVAELNGNPAH